MRVRAHVKALVVTGGATSLLLTACNGGGGGEATTPGEAGEMAQSALIAGAYANPLDAIMFPDETAQAAIDAGVERAVASCMTARGFDYVSGDGFAKHRTAEDAQYTYSVTDPAVAARYGFHPASWVAAVNASGSGPSTRPDGYYDALFGQDDKVSVTDGSGTVIATYDPDSCTGQAKDAVTPDWAEQDHLYTIGTEILLDVSDRVQKNTDVVAANGRWSRCMSDEGFDYATPMDANNDPAFATDLPTADEIAVAVASASCQQSSGLLRTWSQVRAELTQSELDDHPGLVTRWIELNRAAGAAAGSAG